MSAAAGTITTLLNRLRDGDNTAWDQLTEAVYPDLHRIAAAYFRRERPGHFLQPTALVHEVWLKLIALRSLELEDRLHFFALCSRFMRRILVDEARRRSVQARTLDPGSAPDRIETDVLELSRALERLEEAQPRAARVVELRYFGGMTVEEIAGILGVSTVTVKRDWLGARAWLYGQLTGART
jgi:RNA polymerase sigma factor (TIGR02999 family)